MSEQMEFLARIARALDDHGLAYMVTGSLASSFHGRPRATQDIDVVVAPDRDRLVALVDALGAQCYVSRTAVEDALQNASSFNAIDLKTGQKVDFIVRKNRPFSRVEFDRRRQVQLQGRTIWVVSPEDTILSKLDWARQSGSERQLGDAFGVVQSHRADLDLDYLGKWARELGVTDQLKFLLAEAAKQDEIP